MILRRFPFLVLTNTRGRSGFFFFFWTSFYNLSGGGLRATPTGVTIRGVIPVTAKITPKS